MIKKILTLAAVALISIGVVACERPADVASRNVSMAADNFEIMRRVIFYNGITGEYMLNVEGACSIGNETRANQISITCRTGQNEYKKHFLGLSDNVTYFVEQVEGANVSTFHYRVMFRPQTILPDIDFQGDASELFGGADDRYED